MASRSGWLLGPILLSCVACGDDDARGPGGGGGSAQQGGGAAAGSGGSGGGAPLVPLIDEALDGQCPAGSMPPDTGVAPGDDLHKVTLDAYPEAVCNDGTPAIMYVRGASAPAASSTWIIHLQAGGGCGSYEVCRDRWCSYQTSYDAAKMSSKFAPEATNGSGMFSRGAANAFGPANQVYVYYCSSDTWAGRRRDVVLDDPAGVGPSFRLHFNGFRIIEAVNDALRAGVTSDDGVESLPPLTDATRILFAGSSAGSSGQTHALDWWAAQYPSAQVAGLFDSITDPLPEDVADPQISALYLQGIVATYENVHRALFDAHYDESCVVAHPGSDAYLCGLSAHVRLNHVTTPFFVRQDLTDPVQYNYFQLSGATMNQFADALHQTMLRFLTIQSDAEETIAVQPGIHVSNCGQHIVLLNAPWFGVAAPGNNATVETPGGIPLTVHDALGAWVMGNPVQAIDTHPSTISACAQTTTDQ